MNPKDRAEQNRKNASHSTGPASEEGKQKTRLNAFKTGLTGRVLTLSESDQEDFFAFFKQGQKHFQPVGWEEKTLVDAIIQNEWRLQQWRANECNLESLEYARVLHKFSTGCDPANEALAHARASKELIDFKDRTSRYEARLVRQVEKAKVRLEEIQARRKAEAAEQMEEAVRARCASLVANRPWEPSEDGFVFTLAEIDNAIRRRNNKIHADSNWNRRKYATAGSN